ncbi:MAG: ornithine carbamoyltransferase [Phycisphaerae bacterium]
MPNIKHFVNILDHDADYLSALIDKAIADKLLFRQGKLPATLDRKTVVMYFEKPSLRTRLSFETAMTQLGGHGIYTTATEIGLGKREPVKDVARVVSGMCDGFVARTFSHQALVDMAAYATVPVINALTDYSHPCQAMADLMTVKEKFGKLAGLKFAFIGDGNNVARSLAGVCGRLGLKFVIAAPQGFLLEKEFIDTLHAKIPKADFTQINNPVEAVKDADIVYTDTWVSMGQETEKQRRIEIFKGYQIDEKLMSLAKPSAIFMHCLPAYRGFEVTDQIMESPQSLVFEEAENRLHFQRTLLAVLIGNKGIVK